MNSPDKIVVRNLVKVFGARPAVALQMLAEGLHKDEIFRRTGQIVGVQSASFEIRAGEIFVIMGLSGSGKSTLIRLLNRLLEPTAGEVRVDGQDVAAMDRRQLIDLRRRDMSMVFQSFALMPHRTVLENAAFGLEVAGMAKDRREQRAMQVLEQVGLAPFARKLPSELSGGMQQRVGLARALATDPSLMLMDEAFSALDPLKRHEMQGVLLDLQREHKRTIVFVSHDLDEAFRIGDRIAIMEGGRVVQVGDPHEIARNPANDYVRAFFRGVDLTRHLTVGDIARTDGWIYRRETFEMEVEVADRVLELVTSAPGAKLNAPESLSIEGQSLTDEQAAGVRAAFEHRLSLVTGGPGTGKTASIKTIGGLAALQGAKVMLVAFLIYWIRFTYPRFREDQLQAFAWKYLIPISLANILITAVFKVVF